MGGKKDAAPGRSAEGPKILNSRKNQKPMAPPTPARASAHQLELGEWGDRGARARVGRAGSLERGERVRGLGEWFGVQGLGVGDLV